MKVKKSELQLKEAEATAALAVVNTYHTSNWYIGLQTPTKHSKDDI